MNFTCTKNNFLEALRIVEHGVGKNINLPILQNILLRCEKNKLYCTTTDLEIGISTGIFIKTIKEGEYSVPFKTLFALIQNTSEEIIELYSEKNSLGIKTKTTQAHIKGEDPSQFPLLPKVNKRESSVFNFSEVPQNFYYVISALSPTTNKPELAGLYLNFENHIITCVASDGFRLAEKKISLKKTHEENRVLLLPHRTCQELMRAFGQNSIQGKLEATIDAHQAHIEYTPEEGSITPAFHIISRLIDGEYPNYQQIIPDSWNTTISISKTLFFNHIKNAGFFSNKLCEIRMKFSPQQQTCTCATEEYTQGSYTSAIPCKVKGEGQEILVNYRYLLDALQPIHSDEVVIQIKHKDNPIIVSSPQEQYLSLIMPLRS